MGSWRLRHKFNSDRLQRRLFGGSRRLRYEEVRPWILRSPCVPPALQTVDKGQLTTPERPINSTASQRPTRAGFAVFEASALRGNIVCIKGKQAIIESALKSNRAPSGGVPEHGDGNVADRIQKTFAALCLRQWESLRLFSDPNPEHRRQRSEA